MYSALVKPMARRMKRFFVRPNIEQVLFYLRSVKKARIVKGSRGTKTALGCKSVKIRAIMQNMNCEIGAMILAKKEKLLLQALLTRFLAFLTKTSCVRSR